MKRLDMTCDLQCRFRRTSKVATTELRRPWRDGVGRSSAMLRVRTLHVKTPAMFRGPTQPKTASTSTTRSRASASASESPGSGSVLVFEFFASEAPGTTPWKSGRRSSPFASRHLALGPGQPGQLAQLGPPSASAAAPRCSTAVCCTRAPPNKAGASSAFWSAGIEYRTAAQAANGIARGRGASRQRTEFGEGFVDTAAVQPRDTSPPALPLHLARPGRGFCRNRSASIRSGRWLKVPRLPLQAQPGRLCERAWRWHWRSPVLTQSADVLQREVLRHLHLCAIYFGRSPSRLLDECEPSRGILRRSLLEAAAHLSVPVRQDGSLSAAYSIAMQLSNLPLGPLLRCSLSRASATGTLEE